MIRKYFFLSLILLSACNKNIIVEPDENYPEPLGPNFTFNWEYFYKNDSEERKNWIKDIEFGNQNQIWIATYFDGIVKANGTNSIEINSI